MHLADDLIGKYLLWILLEQFSALLEDGGVKLEDPTTLLEHSVYLFE